MYSYYNNGKFSFPPNFDFNIIPGKDSHCTVISIIGESDLHAALNKAEIFESLTCCSMKPMNTIPSLNEFNSEHFGSYLNGYFCEKLRVVFIHLRTLNDGDLLMNKYQSYNYETIKENHFDAEDSAYLKLVYYLFLLSDFVLINVVGINFDPAYITLFTQVNILRKKFKQQTENELKTISTSVEVINNGRLVQPRLLFVFNVFESPLISELKKDQKNLEAWRDRMEETLYAVLKYHNVIGTEYSLAKVQTNSPFVFMRLLNGTPMRSFADFMTLFIRNGLDYSCLVDESANRQAVAFERFILDQIHVLTVCKESIGFGSENISCRNWFKACHKLYNLFSSDKMRFADTLSNFRLAYFKKGCDLSLTVAESHYKDGLPTQYSRDVHYEKAKAARRIFLSIARGPAVLTCVKRLEQNLNKVWAVGRQICEAISVTGQRCKHEVHLTPGSDDMDCWDGSGSNRQSAFGNNSTEDDKYGGGTMSNEDGGQRSSMSVGADKKQQHNLPTMRHSSDVQLVSACSCGRRQGTRRDPFGFKEANYTFYEQMAEMCCFRFSRISLPENNRFVAVEPPPATVSSSAIVTAVAAVDDRYSRQTGPPDDDLSDQSERGLERDDVIEDLSLSPQDGHDMLPRRHRTQDASVSSSNDDRLTGDRVSVGSSSDLQSDGDNGDGDDSSDGGTSVASAAADEGMGPTGVGGGGLAEKRIFIGMFSITDSPRTAPRWPSWSLIDSGPYFSYTHSTGLEYNGFVHGSNFLLPWDVPLKAKVNKVRKQRVKRAFAAGNFVKAFIGFEMECPVGHRFFLAGPDNMMQGSMAGHQVKDAVSGLLTRDIPLYFQCQCSSYLAQLMRIYVAVPNSNLLRLYIQPKVRPGPPGDTPVFTPGSNQPIELEPGHLWVLRLPFAYEKDGHIYRQQADMRIVEECKLLKESIFYEENNDFDE